GRRKHAAEGAGYAFGGRRRNRRNTPAAKLGGNVVCYRRGRTRALTRYRSGFRPPLGFGSGSTGKTKPWDSSTRRPGSTTVSRLPLPPMPFWASRAVNVTLRL